MIEDIEESILRTGFVVKILDIIYYKCINRLIVGEKFIDVAFTIGNGILAFKVAGCDIKHTFRRVFLFDTYAYGLNKMGLTDSSRTKNHQWIESFYRWIVGYGLGNRHGILVRSRATIVLKSKLRIEVWVELHNRLHIE